MARIWLFILQDETESGRTRKQDTNASSHLDGLLNIVVDHEDALELSSLLLPERHDFIAEVLGGENIEGTESFIETRIVGSGTSARARPTPGASSRDFARIRRW